MTKPVPYPTTPEPSMRLRLAAAQITSCLTLAACVAATAGCGSEESKDKDEGPTEITAAFLTSSDIGLGQKVTSLTTEDMVKELEDTDDFYDTEPDEEPDAVSQCTTAELDKIVARTDTTTLRIGSEIDMTRCLEADKTAFEDFDSWDAEMVFKLFFEITCVGADLTKYDGTTFADIDSETSELDDLVCTSSSVRMNTLGTLTFSGTLKDAAGKTHTATLGTDFIGYQGDAVGDVCNGTVEGDDFKWSDGCLQVSRNHNTKMEMDGDADADQGEEDFVSLESVGLVAQNKGDAPYYKSGKFKVRINNWTGEMLYAGLTTPPTWTMTDGASEETGTFPQGAAASLRQQGETAGRLARRLKRQISEEIAAARSSGAR